jgi:hypothetical protein
MTDQTIPDPADDDEDLDEEAQRERDEEAYFEAFDNDEDGIDITDFVVIVPEDETAS